MIGVLKKRLITVFTSVIVITNILGMSVLLVYLHISTKSVCRKHLTEDIDTEFLPNYRNLGIHGIVEMYDEDHLQIMDRKGDIVGGAKKSGRFTLRAAPERIQEAFAGKTVFEYAKIGSSEYLVAYFPLDGNFIGRAAASLDLMIRYEYNFLRVVLFCIPGMLLLSYLASRILVYYAMKPAVDFCRFQENFLSNVSHELRSPLSSLQGNIEVALRKERGAEEYRETLEVSLKEAGRIIELLKNLHLLASSRIKPLELERKMADMKEMLLDVVGSYALQRHNKDIALDVENISEASCLCDKNLMKRVLENLLDNAVKYSPEKGIIRITLSKDTRHINLAIENTARGILGDEIKTLSEPFNRGKFAMQSGIEGKGLGLYIAGYIVRSHNGSMDISLKPEDIFSVVVSIPAE
jgi:signal transduction histidine kinase